MICSKPWWWRSMGCGIAHFARKCHNCEVSNGVFATIYFESSFEQQVGKLQASIFLFFNECPSRPPTLTMKQEPHIDPNIWFCKDMFDLHVVFPFFRPASLAPLHVQCSGQCRGMVRCSGAKTQRVALRWLQCSQRGSLLFFGRHTERVASATQ